MTMSAPDPKAVPLGARPGRDGTVFSVFSAHAEAIELCLFEAGIERRVTLERQGDIWTTVVPAVGPGQPYGFRAHGAWAPQDGHLFNPAKLLLDPYARALEGPLSWHADMTGHCGASPYTSDPSPVDSAPVLPKCLVTEPHDPVAPPRHPVSLIYEAHLKGLTRLHPAIGPDRRGTWGALADPAVIDHLQRLGVSHVELLPVAAFIDDRHVAERGLPNYWGYQPVCPLAPEPRYLVAGQQPRAVIARLAQAGIGVILDVVFNHSGEADLTGPTLSLRGLDNPSYYRLTEGGGYVNDTGTGNTLNIAHPMVARLCLDALRHWASMGVAGFRFDLAVTLMRDGADLMDRVRADPVLGGLVLIAEPWDMGHDGYRLGQFPAPFREWNDRFRDDVRRYWRGDGQRGQLARRLSASAEIFDRHGRGPEASVNMLSAHDGFTLRDLVSYSRKHNEANREGNSDGHHDNLSDNMGQEGPTRDRELQAARARRVRAMLATLFLAQGTPMLLAGDEMGRSQSGNNNAYAQDNPTSWVDWDRADQALIGFTARLSALRRAFEILRQPGFLHGTLREGFRDLSWILPDGRTPQPADWELSGGWPLGMMLTGNGRALLAVLCSGQGAEFHLPPGNWQLELNSDEPDRCGEVASGAILSPGQSVLVFSMRLPGGRG